MSHRKARSGQPYHEGAAVSLQPVIASPSTKINSVRGYEKNWDDQFDIWDARFNNYLYYKEKGPIPQTTDDVAEGQPAVVTYAATSGKHVIYGLAWSYESTPTAGNVQIEDGSGNVVFSEDITTGGPGFFLFDKGLSGTINTSLIITLSDAGVDGKLSIIGHEVQ